MLTKCWVKFSVWNTSEPVHSLHSEYRFYSEIHPLTIREYLHDWVENTDVSKYKQYWQFIKSDYEIVEKLPVEVWRDLIDNYRGEYDHAAYMLRILGETPHD